MNKEIEKNVDARKWVNGHLRWQMQGKEAYWKEKINISDKIG